MNIFILSFCVLRSFQADSSFYKTTVSSELFDLPRILNIHQCASATNERLINAIGKR